MKKYIFLLLLVLFFTGCTDSALQKQGMDQPNQQEMLEAIMDEFIQQEFSDPQKAQEKLTYLKEVAEAGTREHFKEEPVYADLFLAVENNDQDKVKELLHQGLDVNRQNQYGETILLYALKNGYSELSNDIFQFHPDVNIADDWGQTPIMAAAGTHNMELVEKFYEAGADLHLLINDGGAVLFYSAYTGDLEITQFLVEKGVDPHIADEYGKTALDYAKEQGHPEVVEYLTKVMAESSQKGN